MSAEDAHIQPEEATLFDISIRGCAINCNAPLHKGDFVRLEIEMTRRQKALVVDVAVVRTVTGQKYGLEFIKLRDKELARLRTFIVDLTHKP
jgi:hypothetical protein